MLYIFFGWFALDFLELPYTKTFVFHGGIVWLLIAITELLIRSQHAIKFIEVAWRQYHSCQATCTELIFTFYSGTRLLTYCSDLLHLKSLLDNCILSTICRQNVHLRCLHYCQTLKITFLFPVNKPLKE